MASEASTPQVEGDSGHLGLFKLIKAHLSSFRFV